MILYGSDPSVLPVGLFSSHDFVNPNGIGIDIEEQSIFHGDVHSPAGFAGMQSLDITWCTRMIRQPLDMFANHPAVFFRESAYEFFHTVFNGDPHSTPVL